MQTRNRHTCFHHEVIMVQRNKGVKSKGLDNYSRVKGTCIALMISPKWSSIEIKLYSSQDKAPGERPFPYFIIINICYPGLPAPEEAPDLLQAPRVAGSGPWPSGGQWEAGTQKCRDIPVSLEGTTEVPGTTSSEPLLPS